MKRIVIVIAMVVVLFTGCGDGTPLHPVSVGFLRGEYTKTIIAEMDEYQFLGSSDAAFSGDAELMKVIQQQAADAFPDGEYAWHIGYQARNESGYTPHGKVSHMQVYRKDE